MKTLADKKKALCQDYNACLKHREFAVDIKWPDGIIFIKETWHVDLMSFEDKIKTKNRSGPRYKKICFHIGESQNPNNEKN